MRSKKVASSTGVVMMTGLSLVESIFTSTLVLYSLVWSSRLRLSGLEEGGGAHVFNCDEVV